LTRHGWQVSAGPGREMSPEYGKESRTTTRSGRCVIRWPFAKRQVETVIEPGGHRGFWRQRRSDRHWRGTHSATGVKQPTAHQRSVADALVKAVGLDSLQRIWGADGELEFDSDPLLNGADVRADRRRHALLEDF